MQELLDFWFKELPKQHIVKDTALRQLRSKRFICALFALFAFSPNALSQETTETKRSDATHRVLLLGGVNLIQDSDQPKIRELHQTVGLYIANGLRDSLISKGLEVESYMPDQRLPKQDFAANVGLAILECKCTMLLQTTLRAQNGTLQFKFEAMTLKVSRTGIMPLEKWQMKRDFFATEESLSSAIPSEIVKEVTDLLLKNRVFAKTNDAPSPPKQKVVTRSLWDGRQSYNAICSACHTAGLVGSPRIGDTAAWAPRIALGYPALLQSATKGKGVMASQSGWYLDPVELERAVVYLANQSGGTFPEPLVPAGHPGTHTYTEEPPPPPVAKPAPYESLTPEQRLLYGERVYAQHCAACHWKNGEGSGRTPPLKNASTFSNNDAVTRVILQGSSQGVMPAWSSMSNSDISAVINYMRAKFGNDFYQQVQPEDVMRLR